MNKAMKWRLYSLNFLSFFAISMVNTQMIPFLTSLQYTVLERGNILATSAIVAIVGQFVFGYICDRFKKIKVFFALAYTILLISGILMFINTSQMFYYHLCSVALMSGMVKVIMGLNETWMLEIDSENYGKLRAAGALGLSVGSPIAGVLVDTFDFFSLLIALIGTSILLYYFIYSSQDAKKSGDAITLKNIKELIKNRSYLLLVLIYLFVYMIGTADQYVVIDKMLDLGVEHSMVGIKWALQASMEIPLFLLAPKILEKYKTSTLLIFGTLMYAVKFILYGYATSGWLIIGAASLQIVTLPVIMLTSKVLIKEVTLKEVSSSAQMFAMAIFIGFSGLITPLITSYLSASIGYDMTLYVVAIFSVVPLGCIFLYMKMMRTIKRK